MSKMIMFVIAVVMVGCVADRASIEEKRFTDGSGGVTTFRGEVTNGDSGKLIVSPEDLSTPNDFEPTGSGPKTQGCGLPHQCAPWWCTFDGTSGSCSPRSGEDETCATLCHAGAACPLVWEQTKCNNQCAWATDGPTFGLCWVDCHNATRATCQFGGNDQ